MHISPGPGATWMQDHRALWGNQKLRDLCIPKSHDAGMFAQPTPLTTALACERTVLTQTESIYGQLDLGVRRFDIRPAILYIDNDRSYPWHCGHYTGELTVAGWQGGAGEPIHSVVQKINEFTHNHAELIILDITHIYHIMFDKIRGFQVTDHPPWSDMSVLFDTLKRLNHRFTMVGRDPYKFLSDYTLNDFIGNNQAAVVVLIEWDHQTKGDYVGILQGDGFWPWFRNPYANKGDLLCPLKTLELKRQQTNWEVVKATDGDDSQSVINVNRRYYEEHKRDVLKEALRQPLGEMPMQIEMDVIESTVLLSWCLAITALKLHRLNPGQFPFPNDTALGYYGCKPVNIDDKVRSRTNIKVSFDNLGDNWPYMRKWYCGWIKMHDEIMDMFAEDDEVIGLVL